MARKGKAKITPARVFGLIILIIGLIAVFSAIFGEEYGFWDILLSLGIAIVGLKLLSSRKKQELPSWNN